MCDIMSSQVEGTNDSSCLSKYSAVCRTYFNDEFLCEFVNKTPRRAPLIHLGYSVRAAIINCIIEEYVSINQETEFQIVSLGAGFDTLYFKLKIKYPERKVNYFELDLPYVVQSKINSIKKSNKLSGAIGVYSVNEFDVLHGDGYHLIPVDLRNVEAVKTCLHQNNFDPNLPTLFLSECAITYLPEQKSTALIQFASEVPDATFVTYEQIHPEDSFGQVMVNHFSSLGCDLMSLNRYPTCDLQRTRYLDHGFEQCCVRTALDTYKQVVPEAERRRVVSLEPFDEWEEFYLKCCHYAVIIASKGSLSNWSSLCSDSLNLEEPPKRPCVDLDVTECEGTMRYGHTVVSYEDVLLVIGGFGVGKDGSHSRLKDVVTLRQTDQSWEVTSRMENHKFSNMYSSWTPLEDDRYIVYGGRRSPAQTVMQVPKVVTMLESGEMISQRLVETCDKPGRWRHSAVIAKRNNTPMYVVFGGRTSQLEFLNDTWMVDLSEGEDLSEEILNQRTIETLPDQEIQPCARFSHAAAVRRKNNGNDEMWLCGGMGEAGPLSDVWKLDLASGLWSEVSVQGLLPRFSHQACLLRDILVMVGGVNHLDNLQPGVAVIHLDTGHCLEYQLPVMELPKSLMMINHSVVISKNEEHLYIFGGGGNCFSFGTYFNSFCARINVHCLVK